MIAAASAPGKVILTGEHFVIYGEPALVMAIDRYVQVNVEERSNSAISIASSLGVSGIFKGSRFKSEKGGVEAKNVLEPIKISAEATLRRFNEKRGLHIEVTSTLPIAVGLGSSAASAVSTVAAVGRLLGVNLTKELIFDLSTEAERYVHITPSGIDQSISTYGGILSYQRSEGVLPVNIQSTIPLVIGNTGISRRTGKLVDQVRSRMNRFPDLIRPLIRGAGKLTIQAIDALKRGNLNELGLLMDMNHGLLTTLGVSSEALDRLVHAAKRGGSLGAKLTGAGGGGCIVALSSLDLRGTVAQSICKAGGIPFVVDKTNRGVESWIEK